MDRLKRTGEDKELNRILIFKYYTEIPIEWAKFDEIEVDKIVYKFKDKDKKFYLSLSEALTGKSVKIHKSYKKWWV